MNVQGDNDPSEGDRLDEGVRLIDADEAARAAERDDVAERLPDGTPRFGDRPSDVVAGTPSLSFPLAGDVDPSSFDRPVPKGGSLFARKAAAEAGQAGGAPLPPPGSPPVQMPPPSGPPSAPPRTDLAPPSGPPVDPAGRPMQMQPPSDLPHWADPPTGEMPSSLTADRDAGDSWAKVPSAQPRWKDQASDWDDADVRGMGEDPTIAAGLSDLVDAGDEPRRALPPEREPKPRGQSPLTVPGAIAGGGGRDVQTAAVVGLGLVVAFLILVNVRPALALLMVTGIIALCAAEFFAAVRKPGFAPPTLLGLAAVTAAPLATYWKGEGALMLVVVLTMIFGMLWYVAGVSTDRPVANLAVTMFAVVWIGVLGSFAALMLRQDGGESLLIATLIVAVAHDVGAFFGGRQFGNTPLSNVSPNKTMEGLLVGIVASVLAACFIVFVFVFPIVFGEVEVLKTFPHALLLGIAVGVMTPLGDLGQSMVKRDLRVKDMGSLLPGHGGVLDRFDGILFALPTAWYLALVLL